MTTRSVYVTWTSTALGLLVVLGAGCVPRAKTSSATSEPARTVDNWREQLDKLEPLQEDGISGPDEDHDHIRDDIAAYIDQIWGANERKRLSARQYARSLEHGLVYAEDKQRALEAGDEDSRAIECLYAYYSPQDAAAIWKELQARTVDTQARLEAYFKLQNQLGGGYFAGAEEPKRSCAFDQQGLTP
jgi:hypothetical protein